MHRIPSPDEDPATVDELRAMAHPLERDGDLDPLLDRAAAARVVMLGEATHGTSEFYAWRARVSRRLVEERGFRFIGVEGDWPDCRRVDRYVKGLDDPPGGAREVLRAFDRWPTWMWANEEVAAFAEWLREWNLARAPEERAGFYGLDVYSLWDSLAAVRDYLARTDPDALDGVRRALRCFEPFGEDEHAYARATWLVPESCEAEVVGLLSRLRAEAARYGRDDPEAFFDAEQNALVTANAEAYYRAMVRGGPGSWNLRDTHMMDTLDRLLGRHGPGARAIVWAHNTHVGDARATDMAGAGMVNLGQLARERHGLDAVVLVGFSTHRGEVVAGRAWDAPMRVMPVPPAAPGSLEALLHEAGPEDKLLLFHDVAGLAGLALAREPLEARDQGGLLTPRGHRAIGVVYDPRRERYGNYVPTVLPLRYDALLHVDRTSALRPLHSLQRPDREPPETYPSGW